MLHLTNVNTHTLLTQFYGYSKVLFAKKACPVICWFKLFRIYTDDPKSTALCDVKLLEKVSREARIPPAGVSYILTSSPTHRKKDPKRCMYDSIQEQLKQNKI